MRKALLIAVVLVFCGVCAAADDFGKAEVAIDYSFARFNPALFNSQSRNLNGGGGAFVLNFHKGIGLKAEFEGYGSSTAGVTIPAGFPGAGKTISASGNLVTYLFGPQFKFQAGKVRPFAEALFGGAHSNVYANLFNAAGVVANTAPSNAAFAMAFGGGLDIPVSRRVSIRPAQMDYLYTNFSNIFIAKHQSNFRYQAGIVFALGVPPSASPRAACAGAPLEVLPDDPPVAVSVQPADFNPKHKLQYAWTSTGGQVSGRGSSATVDVAGLAPGTYDVKANVSDPKEKKNNAAVCSVAFTVKQPRPPVVACSASPSSIQAGSGTPVTIRAEASSPDQRRIETRKFSTNEGNVQEGTSSAGQQVGQFTSSATLNTKDVQSGPIKVTIAVTDVRGLSGSCVASINVEPLPPPVEVVSETLISECQFNNPRKPGRVDNECKAVLDDVAIRLQHEPNGKLVVVGFADDEEVVTVKQLDAVRAVNVKQYLIGGEGQQQIDPSRIQVRTGTGGGKKAQFYFLPPSGTFTMQNTTIVDETQVKP